MVLVDVPDQAFTDDFRKASDNLQSQADMHHILCMYFDQSDGLCSVIT